MSEQRIDSNPTLGGISSVIVILVKDIVSFPKVHEGVAKDDFVLAAGAKRWHIKTALDTSELKRNWKRTEAGQICEMYVQCTIAGSSEAMDKWIRDNSMRRMVVIATDYNGIVRVVGSARYPALLSPEAASGKAAADLSGYQLSFSCSSPEGTFVLSIDSNLLTEDSEYLTDNFGNPILSL